MTPPYKAKLKPGTIFSIEDFRYKGFYKITGVFPPDNFLHRDGDGYNVIKCTKTGKEFSGRNGFDASFIDTTAHIEGADVDHVKVVRSPKAQLRRKQTWLIKKIAYLQEQLANVNFELSH